MVFTVVTLLLLERWKGRKGAVSSVVPLQLFLSSVSTFPGDCAGGTPVLLCWSWAGGEGCGSSPWLPVPLSLGPPGVFPGWFLLLLTPSSSACRSVCMTSRAFGAFPNVLYIIYILMPLPQLALENDLINCNTGTKMIVVMKAAGKTPSDRTLQRAIQSTCLGWLF